ncbi:MAG: hypothetical protein ACYCXP_00650 [Leptospirillum sp.]
MNAKIAGIVARIAELEHEMEHEIERESEHAARTFRYTIGSKKIFFDPEAREANKAFREGILSYLRTTPLAILIVAPVVYSFYLPLWLLDAWIWLYQAVCFTAYGIQKVDRSRYVILDRGHIPYLNGIEQFNCNYCGYANGLIAYAREVAARTEQFFCPIKHARKSAGVHARYHAFFDYGDAEQFKKGLDKLRTELHSKSPRVRPET